jgi:uncharacterized membrane-anchored protein
LEEITRRYEEERLSGQRALDALKKSEANGEKQLVKAEQRVAAMAKELDEAKGAFNQKMAAFAELTKKLEKSSSSSLVGEGGGGSDGGVGGVEENAQGGDCGVSAGV